MDVQPEFASCGERKQKEKRMKKSSLTLAAGLCAAGLSFWMGSVAQATVAFTPPVLNSFGSEPNGSDTEYFTPNVNISVTALGYAAPGGTAGNEVGIYLVSSDTLLTSTTVNTGLGVNGFNYASITPITLTAGTEYAVSGYFNDTTAVGYTADSGVGAAPEITFNGYGYDESAPGLVMGTTAYSGASIFGPNFQYDVVTPVPEPATILSGVLMLLPFGASTLRILRRKQVA
jgi:hypothetical protein